MICENFSVLSDNSFQSLISSNRKTVSSKLLQYFQYILCFMLIIFLWIKPYGTKLCLKQGPAITLKIQGSQDSFDFDYPVKIFIGQIQIKNNRLWIIFDFFYFSKFHGFPRQYLLAKVYPTSKEGPWLTMVDYEHDNSLHFGYISPLGSRCIYRYLVQDVYIATWFKITRTILKIRIHWDKSRIFFLWSSAPLVYPKAAALGPPSKLRQLRRPNLASNNSGI